MFWLLFISRWCYCLCKRKLFAILISLFLNIFFQLLPHSLPFFSASFLERIVGILFSLELTLLRFLPYPPPKQLPWRLPMSSMSPGQESVLSAPRPQPVRGLCHSRVPSLSCVAVPLSSVLFSLFCWFLDFAPTSKCCNVPELHPWVPSLTSLTSLVA